MQLYSVEKGKVVPSNQFIEKIAAEFGIDHDWLFTGAGAMSDQDCGIDEKLIKWLKGHPEVVRELRKHAGLD